MRCDPIDLEIFKNLYHSIAEEMGAALRRTAFSPNIKERRDYSCAVFDGEGQVIAMGDHMPVHLGSMPMSVQAAINEGPMESWRYRDAERPVPRRNAPSGYYVGRAGICRATTGESAVQVLNFMSPRARITPMSAALMRDRWDFAAKSTRRACGFLR